MTKQLTNHQDQLLLEYKLTNKLLIRKDQQLYDSMLPTIISMVKDTVWHPNHKLHTPIIQAIELIEELPPESWAKLQLHEMLVDFRDFMRVDEHDPDNQLSRDTFFNYYTDLK